MVTSWLHRALSFGTADGSVEQTKVVRVADATYRIIHLLHWYTKCQNKRGWRNWGLTYLSILAQDMLTSQDKRKQNKDVFPSHVDAVPLSLSLSPPTQTHRSAVGWLYITEHPHAPISAGKPSPPQVCHLAWPETACAVCTLRCRSISAHNTITLTLRFAYLENRG